MGRAAPPRTWCCGTARCRSSVGCGLSSSPFPSMRIELSGWGKTAPTAADVVVPDSDGEVRSLVADAPARGVLARGLARSYGDAAQNAGGRVVLATGLDRIHDVDLTTGEIDVDAGASLDWLM